MIPRFRLLGLAIGIGALALAFSLTVIDRSAAQRSIGLAANSIGPATPGGLNQTGNLLINPDFENGYTRSFTCCNNIAVPIGWNIKWYTDTDPGGSGYRFYQPEIKLDDNTQWPFCDGCAPNVPPRIHSGRYAVDSFKSFASQDVSLYQQVGHIPIGAVVTAAAWLHAWVTRCNPFPKNFPPQPAISLYGSNASADGTCTPDETLPASSNRMMVGIDPTGGIDPRATSVIWNIGDPNTPGWYGPYDYYSSTLPVTVTAEAYTATIFLRGMTTSSAKFSDIYFDTASLSYSFPVSLTELQDRPWPLFPTIAITLEAPISLTQLTADLIDPIGLPVTLGYSGTTETEPTFTSRWEMHPLIAGEYVLTLTAIQLPDPVVQTIDVTALPYSSVQDQFPPPAWLTFTLYAPISLTQVTQAVIDPLGVNQLITLVATSYISPNYVSQWRFAPIVTGVYTLTLDAAEFIQPWSIPILAASDRVDLPLVMRGFDEP